MKGVEVVPAVSHYILCDERRAHCEFTIRLGSEMCRTPVGGKPGDGYLAIQVAPAGLELPDSSLLLPESFQVSEIFGPTYSAFV